MGKKKFPGDTSHALFQPGGWGPNISTTNWHRLTTPLSAENKLLLLVGALGGTGLQGFSKWVVMSKSPLTGTIFRSITGGNFGVWMKHAGYDLMIVEGKAAAPTYIHIDPGGVHFLDAADLWGLDYRRLQAQLRENHGDRTESACIGPAGEKLVRYAVIHSGERTASRGGMGTVMGSKNLKAVSINVPIKKPSPFDPATFKGLIKTQVGHFKGAPPQTDHDHSGDTVHHQNREHDGHPAHQKLPGREHPDHRRPVRRPIL